MNLCSFAAYFRRLIDAIAVKAVDAVKGFPSTEVYVNSDIQATRIGVANQMTRADAKNKKNFLSAASSVLLFSVTLAWNSFSQAKYLMPRIPLRIFAAVARVSCIFPGEITNSLLPSTYLRDQTDSRVCGLKKRFL